MVNDTHQNLTLNRFLDLTGTGVDPNSDSLAVDLNGTTQYLQLDASDSANFNMAADSFTIAAWVYTDTITGNHNIISKYNQTGSKRAIQLRISNDFILFNVSKDGSALATVSQGVDPMTIGKWFFIVARYDRTAGQLSLRHYDEAGFLRNKTTNFVDDVFITTEPLLIGSQAVGPLLVWDGRIDSVGVWKGRALTNNQCDALYNFGRGRIYANLTIADKVDLLAYWDLKESSGTRLDSHSNGYDLIANGSPLNIAGIPGTSIANANGNYSSAPVTHYIQPPAGKVYRISQLIISVQAPSLRFDFYDGVEVKAKGVIIHSRVPAAVITDITDGEPPTNLAGWEKYSNDGTLKTDIYTASIDFMKSGQVLRLDGNSNERLEVVLEDDYSLLESHTFKVIGEIENTKT